MKITISMDITAPKIEKTRERMVMVLYRVPDTQLPNLPLICSHTTFVTSV